MPTKLRFKEHKGQRRSSLDRDFCGAEEETVLMYVSLSPTDKNFCFWLGAKNEFESLKIIRNLHHSNRFA